MSTDPVSVYCEIKQEIQNRLILHLNTLRANPDSAPEVSTALSNLVIHVHTLQAASRAMATHARSSPYVSSRPSDYFSHQFPGLCGHIAARLVYWADILEESDGRGTNVAVLSEMRDVIWKLGD
jgi:hypothetical protein